MIAACYIGCARLCSPSSASPRVQGIKQAQPAALAQQKCKLLLVAAALPSYREYCHDGLKLQPPQGCLVCYRPLASQSSAGLLNALDVQISLCQMYMIYTAKLIFVARPHLEGRGQNLEPSPSTERGVGAIGGEFGAALSLWRPSGPTGGGF